MRLSKIYADRQVVNVEAEEIDVIDPSKFVWLTFQKISSGDAKVLAQDPLFVGKAWAYHRPVDFVEVDDKLYYVIQMPGLYMRVGEEDIPAFLFPIRGTDQFIVQVYEESASDILEPYFSEGYFITSWEGMLVSMLEPVPETLAELVNKNYVKEI